MSVTDGPTEGWTNRSEFIGPGHKVGILNSMYKAREKKKDKSSV